MNPVRRVKLPSKRDRDFLRQWLLDHKDLSSAALAKQCGLTIDRIMVWKVQCDVVDPRDRKLFTAWMTYKQYSLAEFAVLSGVTIRTIRYYLDKYHIKVHTRSLHTRSSRQFSAYRSKLTVVPVLDHGVIHDPDHLRELYVTHGVRIMGRMCGVSTNRMTYILRRHKILDPQRRWLGINNPFKDRNVLFQKYVMGGMTLTECANEAGTCPHTIRNWLVKFGIRPRDIRESNQVRHNKKDSVLLTSTA